MTIDKTTQGYIAMQLHNGYLVKRQYIGYTKTQAKKLFTEYLITLESESKGCNDDRYGGNGKNRANVSKSRMDIIA